MDWSKTRAYCLGLTGMFLNLNGREAQGIVAPGADAAALKAEITAKLTGLPDTAPTRSRSARPSIPRRCTPARIVENAPDLLIGYNAGYRVSWDCATGIVAGPVFEDNTKAWSGDHCIDPRLVPGVFFCNRPIGHDRSRAHRHRADGAATVRHRAAAYMDGRPLAGLV